MVRTAESFTQGATVRRRAESGSCPLGHVGACTVSEPVGVQSPGRADSTTRRPRGQSGDYPHDTKGFPQVSRWERCRSEPLGATGKITPAAVTRGRCAMRCRSGKSNEGTKGWPPTRQAGRGGQSPPLAERAPGRGGGQGLPSQVDGFTTVHARLEPLIDRMGSFVPHGTGVRRRRPRYYARTLRAGHLRPDRRCRRRRPVRVGARPVDRRHLDGPLCRGLSINRQTRLRQAQPERWWS